MRPLKLTLRAFGPFAGEEVVDFTRYGENAFLLINGPTGAGKTTILDGICYALYGEASGASRSEHFLRSQRASREMICQVEFLFRIGPRTFSLKRRPAQAILYKEKPRELLHQVEFCEVDADGILIGERLTKVNEVRERIEELLGFSSDQFRQVVVLPQGEFRRLLLAKSDEKEKILEKLFNTGRYKFVEESLKRRRFALGTELKELKAAIEGILGTSNVASPGELEERITELAARRADLAATLAALTLRQQLCHERLRAAQGEEERFVELDRARTAFALLDARRVEMAASADRVEQASRALLLVELEEAIARGKREQEARTLSMTTLEERIVLLDGQTARAGETVAAARQEQGRIATEAAEQIRLQGLLVKIRELDGYRRELCDAESAATTALQGRELLRQAIAAGEARISALTTAIEELSLASASLGQGAGEIARLEQLCRAREALDADLLRMQAVETEMTAAEALRRQTEVQREEARAAYETVQRQFLSGQAAHLAASLADGHPCPVCGAREHPHPARVEGAISTEPDLDGAAGQLRIAEAQLEQAWARCAELSAARQGCTSGMARLTESLGEAAQQPLAELCAQHEDARQRQLAAAAAAEALRQNRQERERLIAALSGQRTEEERADATLVAATANVEQLRTLVARIAAEVGAASAEEVGARIEAIVRFVAEVNDRLHRAEEDLAASAAALQQGCGERLQLETQITQGAELVRHLSESFAVRLREEGFADAAAYRAARMEREAIDRLRETVASFREAHAGASTRLERAQIACLGMERPDLPAVQVIAAEIDRELGARQQESGLLEGQHAALLAALCAIGEMGKRIALLEAEFSVVGRLAEVTGGQNPQRMTLQRYVLAALFEEVARAASRRLAKMSRGRYHLVRSELPRDGKSTGGLDLDVIDDYIGERRPAFTLSGGESFLASLALALGLSDVVLAQSGGRYLDCIFIDEGFGTLDGETLDFALNTLIELHRAGRVIGIISHVAELKERIPLRIDVVVQKEGSTIVQTA